MSNKKSVSSSMIDPKVALDSEVKLSISNMMTTDTVQTITAEKFLNNANGDKRTNLTLITPSDQGDIWSASIQYMKGDEYTGYVESGLNADGSTFTQIVSHKNVNGSDVYGQLKISSTADGQVLSYAPTPDIAASSTEILNAAWFNQKFQKVSVLPANPNENIFYLIPE